jgi:hypothetical protein
MARTTQALSVPGTFQGRLSSHSATQRMATAVRCGSALRDERESVCCGVGRLWGMRATQYSGPRTRRTPRGVDLYLVKLFKLGPAQLP